MNRTAAVLRGLGGLVIHAAADPGLLFVGYDGLPAAYRCHCVEIRILDFWDFISMGLYR